MATKANQPSLPIDPAKKKDKWEVRNLIAETSHKWLILILGGAVAAVYLWFERNQQSDRAVAAVVTQRENAESQLRAELFKTLFAAYFASRSKVEDQKSGGVVGSDGKSSKNPDPVVALSRLKQDIMFVDLLSRNFENIDVRPVFEDLDSQLTRLLRATGIGERAKDVYAVREQLRRVAVGATSRQIAALIAVEGAVVTDHELTQCENDEVNRKDTDQQGYAKPILSSAGATVVPAGLEDGQVRVVVYGDDQARRTSHRIDVTFYDMPILENVILPSHSPSHSPSHLPTHNRVAFTLHEYYSYFDCVHFSREMDKNAQSECASIDKNCQRATIQVVRFPSTYVAMRERPHAARSLAASTETTDPLSSFVRSILSSPVAERP